MNRHQTLAMPVIRSLVLLLVAWSCSPISPRAITKQLKRTEDAFQDHVGFMLYDLETRRSIIEYNSSKYFTPASNTKIATFFASLKILNDSIPALRYVYKPDSLIIKGTGDPSFLNLNVFDNRRIIEFLKKDVNTLYFFPSNFYTDHFGHGWSWEDYGSSYSAERSYFPMYGNVFEVTEKKSGGLTVQPSIFAGLIEAKDSSEESRLERVMESNKTRYYPGRNGKARKWTIPYRPDSSLLIQLLEDTLKRPVKLIDSFPTESVQTFYSVPADSLYKVMMQQSDNFIAEQLLLICSGVLSDSLKPEIAIRHVSTNFLNDLPDKVVWVDGSGLSRYNLFTPRAIVALWEKIYQLVPRDRLFKILATGGKPGTIRNYFKSDTPYLFGKTGTLSNIHCLSGYLVTKKGKTLIFSFMNTNFTVPVRDVRKTMECLLMSIQEKY